MTEITSSSQPVDVPPQLIRDVRAARNIVALTGAGMSAESGIPTFRDAQSGFWANFDPSLLASASGFNQDPAFVWGWYEGRRRDVRHREPNAGHFALQDLATLDHVQAMTVITQNVDNLHERAGSTDVIHLHGNLFDSKCFACQRPHIADASPAVDELLVPHGEGDRPTPPPRCRRCNGMVRPAVVWFGELLSPANWMRACQLVHDADLVLMVGSSGEVYPAALLPRMALERGCPVWLINPTEASDAALGTAWRSTAAVALPALVTACAKGAVEQ